VAALAGIPKTVTAEARRYLAELERERDALRNSVSPQPQLPLFGPGRAAAPPTALPPVAVEASAARPEESAALEALRAVDPDSLSPREALDLVFRLKQLDAKRDPST
jgi:DNA mismatch repair protein MutS